MHLTPFFRIVGEPQKKLSKAIARELLETEENYLNLLRFTVNDLKEALVAQPSKSTSNTFFIFDLWLF